MKWIEPAHSRRQVDRAGADLAAGVAGERHAQARRIAANWRSAHAFPVNTIQNGVRRRATEAAYGPVLISQRLKRTPSTIAKLQRYPRMKLSRMQDIGGCRAVLNTVARAQRLRQAQLRSRAKHRLVREYDYIARPKESGYRGIHLVYSYRGTKRDTHDGLLVEVQLRSRLQHVWATAVETAGALRREALKASRGEAEWLRFFALVSSWFAHQEQRPLVPGTPGEPGEIAAGIRRLAAEIGVVEAMQTTGFLARSPVKRIAPKAQYFLLERRPDGHFSVTGYLRDELERANEAYFDTEAKVADVQGGDAVLVSVDSIEALKRAYPNYHLDTTSFLARLRPILNG